MPDLRKSFFSILEEMMAEDEKIIFITFDLGFSFAENLQSKFPERFINAGCIESAGVGIAAGLARGGLKPYLYSNAIFLLSRAHEFVRDDIAYNNTNVKLCGTGASGFLGFSHNIGENESEENWLKGMPNIKSFYPKDEQELKQALISDGCAYIRL